MESLGNQHGVLPLNLDNKATRNEFAQLQTIKHVILEGWLGNKSHVFLGAEVLLKEACYVQHGLIYLDQTVLILALLYNRVMEACHHSLNSCF